MERVTDINSMIKIADDWAPPFKFIDNIDETADVINIPHEDYPEFVDKTKEAIEIVVDMLEENPMLRENDVKSMHKFVFNDKMYIRTGDYRFVNVSVGDSFMACEPYLISPLMMSIFPIDSNMDKEEIIDWYKKFETIHPFEDGNGRIGGIFMAALSYSRYGVYLVSRS